MLPTFEAHDARIASVLSDNGREFCGRSDRHPYEHFRIMGRKTFYESIEAMQKDLDAYVVRHNTERPHQGRGMKGRTSANVFFRCLLKPKAPKEDTMKKAA